VGEPMRLVTRRTNDAVETKIAEQNFTATMSVPSWNAPRLAYAGQIRCWPSVSLPGDSGAIFVDRENRVVGMLVGGTAGLGDVVTPIGEIMTYPGWNGQPSLVTRIPDGAVAPRNDPARSDAPGNSTNTALPPVNGTTFTALKARYETLFERCQPLPSRAGDIAYYLDHLRAGKARYEAVGQATRVPWWFIGIVHGLEGSFRFDRHLHNGDPLTGKTVRVPAGRPSSGAPPFAWSDSAADALQYEGLADKSDWSLARTLYRFERYNGYGYYQFGINSPYLWSFSNLYTKGKYIADHKFDPNVVSDQCGAAVLLKQLVLLGEASF
jgi:lysozyme family protein